MIDETSTFIVRQAEKRAIGLVLNGLLETTNDYRRPIGIVLRRAVSKGVG
jgi:hypothetical protein